MAASASSLVNRGLVLAALMLTGCSAPLDALPTVTPERSFKVGVDDLMDGAALFRFRADDRVMLNYSWTTGDELGSGPRSWCGQTRIVATTGAGKEWLTFRGDTFVMATAQPAVVHASGRNASVPGGTGTAVWGRYDFANAAALSPGAELTVFLGSRGERTPAIELEVLSGKLINLGREEARFSCGVGWQAFEGATTVSGGTGFVGPTYVEDAHVLVTPRFPVQALAGVLLPDPRQAPSASCAVSIHADGEALGADSRMGGCLAWAAASAKPLELRVDTFRGVSGLPYWFVWEHDADLSHAEEARSLDGGHGPGPPSVLMQHVASAGAADHRTR